ncbi:MAG: (d)CMP kinase [Maricaulaceae bacterium]
MDRPVTIAIDGTFASGKGTLASRLAAYYELPYLDTGKLYRAVAKRVMDTKTSPENAEGCAAHASQLEVKELSDQILKSGPIGVMASKIAVHPPVRAALLKFQQDFAAKGAVMDGRDIGTVICPNAAVKLFVDAEPEERARRRHAELTSYGEDITYETVLSQLRERDARDSGRDIAPLKPAEDAHLLDTTNLSIERAFEVAISLCDAVLAAKSV